MPLSKPNFSTLIDMIEARTGKRLDIDAVIASPDVYIDDLFTTLVIQKEILEGASLGCRSLVPGTISASDALRSKILELSQRDGGDGISIKLKFFVADDDSKPQIIDGNLVVGDGAHNNSIYDPLWANYRKASSTSGAVDGGGGCNSFGSCGMLLTLLAGLAAFCFKRKR